MVTITFKQAVCCRWFGSHVENTFFSFLHPGNRYTDAEIGKSQRWQGSLVKMIIAFSRSAVGSHIYPVPSWMSVLLHAEKVPVGGVWLFRQETIPQP